MSAVARATGGNPLLVHRAADVLADLEGDLEQALDGDDWCLPSADVATWVLTRINDLSADAVTMIRSVAILGDKADLRAVEAVARAFGGISDARLLADQLAELDILVRSRELGFVHPFVELSVYAEISPIVRTTAHLLAAQQLRLRQRPEAEVAAHLLHTEPADDESTVDALVDAAQRLLDVDGDARMAGRFLDRAMKEPPSSQQLPFVYSLRAEVMARTGTGDPVRSLRNAFALSSDPVPMIRSALAVIEQQWDRPSATDVIRLLATVTAVGGLRPSDRVVLALATALLDGVPAAGALLDLELRALVEIDEVTALETDEGNIRVVAASCCRRAPCGGSAGLPTRRCDGDADARHSRRSHAGQPDAGARFRTVDDAARRVRRIGCRSGVADSSARGRGRRSGHARRGTRCCGPRSRSRAGGCWRPNASCTRW